MRNGTVVSPTVRSRVSTALNRETTQLRYRNGVVATNTNSRRGGCLGGAPRNVTGEPAGRLSGAHGAEGRWHGEADGRRARSRSAAPARTNSCGCCRGSVAPARQTRLRWSGPAPRPRCSRGPGPAARGGRHSVTVSVSSSSRLSGSGRLTTRLFWLRTRTWSSRPCRLLLTERTTRRSASRSVSALSAYARTRTRSRVRPSIQKRSGVKVVSTL